MTQQATEACQAMQKESFNVEIFIEALCKTRPMNERMLQPSTQK